MASDTRSLAQPTHLHHSHPVNRRGRGRVVNRLVHRISAAMDLLIDAGRIASDEAWATDSAVLARACTDLNRVAHDAHQIAQNVTVPAVLS